MSVVIDGTTGVSGNDGSAATPALRGDDANTGVFFPAADTIAFAEGGVEVMRITPDARVGIGTTSPSTALEVNGTVTATTFAGNVTGNVTGNISGNAATASTASALSATTWQRITGSGITQGSYGSISVSGATGGYIGINFPNHNLTWMSDNQSSVSFGVYKNNNAWAFYFNNTGSLVVGSVPASNITGLNYGAVGTYIEGALVGRGDVLTEGSTIAGSSIYPGGVFGNNTAADTVVSSGASLFGGSVLSGTWRVMGRSRSTAASTIRTFTTLFVRIS